VFNKLLQAGVDKSESQREARLKETLSNLKRVFPGTFLGNALSSELADQ